MDLHLLERVITEQKDELKLWNKHFICSRPEEQEINLDSERAQVVIGVRRSGKSTLCFNRLRKSKHPFAYVNFDDERLITLKSEDLDDLLSTLYKVYGDVTYFFFDEIQNVEAWPLFINRLLRLQKHIILTGSNAKLLSSELSTHMTGRAHQIALLPFSFQDICTYKQVEVSFPITTYLQGQLRALFETYLSEGGFPQLVKAPNERTSLISELIDNILNRDICQRHAIRHTEPFYQLAHHLLNVAPTILNYRSLYNRLGGDTSEQTIKRYVSYLKQAYLLVGIKKFSTKSHIRIRNEKVYPIDVSFMNHRDNTFAGENLGWRLETLILLELLRRKLQTGSDIYYYQEGRHEVDFLICHGNQPKIAIQVAYSVSNQKTLKRECAALEALSNQLKCEQLLLITDYHYEDIPLKNGRIIHVRPAYEWLLQPSPDFLA